MQLLYMLFSSLLFLFSFGHLARISFLRQEVNIYLYEFILVILTIIFFFRYTLRPLNVHRLPHTSIILFVIYLFISYLISTPNFTLQQNVIGILFFLRLAMYLLFFIYFLYFIEENQRKKKFVFFWNRLTAIITAFIVLTSVGQYFFYPDIRNLLYAGWDPHLNRLVSVFLEPPVSGAIYGLLFLYLLLNSNAVPKFWRIGSLMILFIFILITFSRGTYVGFFLTLMFVLVRQLKLKRIYIGLVCVILAAGLIIVSQLSGEGAHLTRMSTIESRIENYQEAFGIWTKQPFFGVGYNHIRYVRGIKPDPNPVDGVSHAESAFHSSFLVILVASGVIGLILFAYVLYQLSFLSRYSMYAVLFLSVSSLTDNVILHPFILFLFLVLAALSVIHLSDTLP